MLANVPKRLNNGETPSRAEYGRGAQALAGAVSVAGACLLAGCTTGHAKSSHWMPLVGRDSVRLLRAPAGATFDDPVPLAGEQAVAVTFSPAGGHPTPAYRDHLYEVPLGGGAP